MSVRSRQSDVKFPPAYCHAHGIFAAVGTVAMSRGATKVTLSNCVTNCPKCGEQARILDGTYTAFEDRLHIILDPSLPKHVRAALLALVQKVTDNNLDLEQARAEAERISPKAGRLFDVANWSGEAKAALYGTCLIAAATFTPKLSFSPGPPPVAINQTINVVGPKGAIRQQLFSSTVLTPPPRPQPNPHRKRPTR
jgi:hypothetical protein